MMTRAVVFNKAKYPVNTAYGVIGAQEWLYVEDVDSVTEAIGKGELVIAQAPQDPLLINPVAAVAFEQLRAALAADAVAIAEVAVEMATEPVTDEVKRPKSNTRNNKKRQNDSDSEGDI